MQFSVLKVFFSHELHMHVYRNNKIYNACSCTQGIVENRNDTVQTAIMRKKLRLDDLQDVRGDDDHVFDQATVVAPTHVSNDTLDTSWVSPTEVPEMKVAAPKDDMTLADDGSEDDDNSVPTRYDDTWTVFNDKTAWFDADYKRA